MPLINSLFPPDICELIYRIPLSLHATPDRLVWSAEKKGEFSVKSAYKVAYNLSHVAQSQFVPTSTPSFWKKFWKAKIPGKVRVCLWKACINILPTRARLVSRHVPITQNCVLCDGASETVEHICRDCPYVSEVIGTHPQLSLLVSSLPLSTEVSFGEWLVDISLQLSSTLFEVLLMLIWAIWKERNARVWDGVFSSQFSHCCLFSSNI